MNRYIESSPYINKHSIIAEHEHQYSEHEQSFGQNEQNKYQQKYQEYLLQQEQQKFQFCDNSFCSQEQVTQENTQQYLPSVRKYLSQPNPLMHKIQFTSYYPKWYYPRKMNKLPKCLNDYQSCINIDKNNVNAMIQSVKGHEKYKNNINSLIGKKTERNINSHKNSHNLLEQCQNNNNNGNLSSQEKKKLKSIQQYYQNKALVYEKYNSQYDIKLQSNRYKLKYFATYVIDMAKIFKKQIKQKQKQKNYQNITKINNKNISNNITKNTLNSINSTVPLKPLSSNNINSKRSGSFVIRQTKSNININQKDNQNNNNNYQNPTSHSQLLPSNSILKPSPIQFDSNFQSGNLFRVYQTNSNSNINEYDLVLQNDINTKGNTQWFFFSIKNVPKNTTIKINIVNLSKPSSLFNIGMRPTIFSMMRYQKRNIGWTREGTNISYQPNHYIHKQSSKSSSYFTLSFQYKFIYDGDIVYFSHSIPYTFTDLSNYLNKITNNKVIQPFIKMKNIGLTIGQNQVDLIEITNFKYSNKNKKIVWILARQHPGETNSGFILQGILDYLLNTTSEQSKILLNNFIFKIVPMLNIDGVIHGNSRAQFIGCDPNRRWYQPNKLHNPIIHSIKHYIQKDKPHIQMILDLHSHSRKLGTFFYGNTMSSNTAATRIFPLMVSKKDKRFTYKYCRFNGANSSTARQSLFQALKIPLIYTVESSFYGYQQDNDYKIKQYLPKDYKQMGGTLMETFKEYQVKKNYKNMKFQKQISLKLADNINPEESQQDLFKQLQKQLTKYQDNQDNQSLNSDSDPQGDQYNEKQFKKLVMQKQALKKKKKVKKDKKTVLLKINKNKQQQIPSTLVLKKTKNNNSQSYYKNYFSGKAKQLNKQDENNENNKFDLQSKIKLKKQTFNMGIQVNLPISTSSLHSQTHKNILHSKQRQSHPGILTQRQKNYHNQFITSISSKLPLPKQILPLSINSLCVIGQKVQEIEIYGNTVGIQVQINQNKEIFMSRNQNINNERNSLIGSSISARKSFSVRMRTNSFLQVKENNFIQRGDSNNKNLFYKK